MIKIIKHGHAPYQMTCKNCECVFTFEDYDIRTNKCQWGNEKYIYCPECEYPNLYVPEKDNYLTWY